MLILAALAIYHIASQLELNPTDSDDELSSRRTLCSIPGWSPNFRVCQTGWRALLRIGLYDQVTARSTIQGLLYAMRLPARYRSAVTLRVIVEANLPRG
jgi:hypothetical protein